MTHEGHGNEDGVKRLEDQWETGISLHPDFTA